MTLVMRKPKPIKIRVNVTAATINVDAVTDGGVPILDENGFLVYVYDPEGATALSVHALASPPRLRESLPVKVRS